MSRALDRHAPYLLPLLVGRLADTATTLYGLTEVGVSERNAFVAALIDVSGPGAGLLMANLLSVALIVLAVEVGVAIVGTVSEVIDPSAEKHLVKIGYLPVVVTSFGAAVYNVAVIAMA